MIPSVPSSVLSCSTFFSSIAILKSQHGGTSDFDSVYMQSQMGAVMLTVQKANNLAMAFYKKLR